MLNAILHVTQGVGQLIRIIMLQFIPDFSHLKPLVKTIYYFFLLDPIENLAHFICTDTPNIQQKREYF